MKGASRHQFYLHTRKGLALALKKMLIQMKVGLRPGQKTPREEVFGGLLLAAMGGGK